MNRDMDYSATEIAEASAKTMGNVKYHVVTLRDFENDPICNDDILRDCLIRSSHDTIEEACKASGAMASGTVFKCASNNGVLRELTEIEHGYIESLDSDPGIMELN